MTMKIRTYSELITFPTFEERYRYLRLEGKVGEDTFGFDRWLNQSFYKDPEWRAIRDKIIIRDNGCDLACEGYEIYEKVLIHHINPITIKDILERNPMVFDPENVVCTILNTHNAIHYGDDSLIIKAPIQRHKNDTCPWRN